MNFDDAFQQTHSTTSDVMHTGTLGEINANREKSEHTMSNQVFVSYSSKDIDFVNWLVVKLQSEKVNVWFDRLNLNLGDSIADSIDVAIKSSDFVLLVLSSSSVNSVWVNRELNTAVFSTLQKHGTRIIPLLIEDCDIPNYLSMIKYADFRSEREKSLQELVKVIQENGLKIKPIDWNTIDYLTFERLIHQILNKEGFTVNKVGGRRDKGYDFFATYEGEEFKKGGYLAEVKLYRDSKIGVHNIVQLYGAAKVSNIKNIILITNSSITQTAKQFVSEKMKEINFLIWDESHLLGYLSKYTELREAYFSITTDPQVIKNENKMIDVQLNEIDKLIKRLRNCPSGRVGWKKYENICIDILKFLFVPPLKLPKIQSRTESGIDIRDAIFPNRSSNENWRFIREDYAGKYILFEFKNYTADTGLDLGKDEVNQVKNYLYHTIGRIGIICSPKRPSTNGIFARKMAYIEEKKLILFLTNEDLTEMMMKKYMGEDPSDIIVDLIDEFNLSFG